MDVAGSVDELLAEGLNWYGRGFETEAIASWRAALEVDPVNPRAIDYLEAAGALDTATHAKVVQLDDRRPQPSSAPVSHAIDLEAVLQAVKERDYDKALRLLYAVRRVKPDDKAISRSIQHIKARITRDLITQLGALDRAPAPSELRTQGRSAEMELVAPLIDGIATLDDVIRSSPLGQFRTLQVLNELLADDSTASSQKSRLSMVPTPSATPVEASPSFEDMFRDATEAYLRGDREGARAKFEACAGVRPTDRRVLHNLQRLRSKSRR